MVRFFPPRASSPRPPVATTRPVRLWAHGRERIDPYAWLRAADWQEVLRDPSGLEPEIRDYLDAENAYTRAVLAPTEPLQAALFEEYRGRLLEEDQSVPEPDGPHCYYFRFEHGGQHPIFCRRPRHEDGPETVLFDGDAESQGATFFQVGACVASPDHRRVAVAVDERGSELYGLRFREIESGRWLEDRIEETSGNVVFLTDEVVLYTVLDEQHRPRRVKRHVLGTDPSTDEVVYDEPDIGWFVSLYRTESERFVVIEAHAHDTSECWLLDPGRPDSAPVRVALRTPHVEYEVSHHDDRLVLRTNAGGAEDFALMAMPLSKLGQDFERESWTPLIPHEPGRLLLGAHIFSGHVAVLERKDSLPALAIYAWRGDQLAFVHRVQFDEEAYSLTLLGSREFDTSTVRFAYSSMATPRQVFDYDMATRTRVLKKEQFIPSGHDPARYRCRRLMVPSHDGELVPVSLMHAASTPLDGTAPLLLEGYGAYGTSVPAAFEVHRMSLVDRGFVVAIAHVRGGMERGYRWYREGKLEKKENSFLDFIAAAEGLVEKGIAHPERLAAQGDSAGGLLVAAVANLRPDLFAAVVADVPFVDVLNTMLDETLPLTPPEWREWGNPIEDAEAYDRIAGYCPYDNVKAQPYPHLLVFAGLTDTRVTYWEPAKWVAKLRATKTDDRLLLLETRTEAGHGGAAGRLESLREKAVEHAFLISLLAPSNALEDM